MLFFYVYEFMSVLIQSSQSTAIRIIEPRRLVKDVAQVFLGSLPLPVHQELSRADEVSAGLAPHCVDDGVHVAHACGIDGIWARPNDVKAAVPQQPRAVDLGVRRKVRLWSQSGDEHCALWKRSSIAQRDQRLVVLVLEADTPCATPSHFLEISSVLVLLIIRI